MPSQNHTPLDDLIKSLNDKASSQSFSKESEPARSAEPVAIHEVVEHEITDQDVKKYVEPRQETAKLSEDLKAAGLKATTPAQFTTTALVDLPISDEKVEQGLHAPVNSSFRWLAEFCKHILRESHLALKTVHGKVVRVFTR